MSTDTKLTTGERIFQIVVGIGIWLPIIGAVLLLITNDGNNSLNGALAFAYLLIFLAKMEIGGILLLLIYAVWFKPWRLTGTLRDTFFIHVFAASLAVLIPTIYFVPLIIGDY
ncbi:hypothetical protein C4J98_0442 [Pseudomonas orientalis]|uniref:hypothetical protein n=1 Tax=Pseudomonas orientalis TaxID=76758 RepID=UPI000F5751AA|nr:hypothetical protein [Pseudomonas orientalis]AZE81885.1 hypothetical protein C4J98_0442 [Pseudomonas orientalis]